MPHMPLPRACLPASARSTAQHARLPPSTFTLQEAPASASAQQPPQQWQQQPRSGAGKQQRPAKLNSRRPAPLDGPQLLAMVARVNRLVPLQRLLSQSGRRLGGDHLALLLLRALDMASADPVGWYDGPGSPLRMHLLRQRLQRERLQRFLAQQSIARQGRGAGPQQQRARQPQPAGGVGAGGAAGEEGGAAGPGPSSSRARLVAKMPLEPAMQVRGEGVRGEGEGRGGGERGGAVGHAHTGYTTHTRTHRHSLVHARPRERRLRPGASCARPSTAPRAAPPSSPTAGS